MPHIFIKDLEEGQKITDLYLVFSKQLRISRTNKPYLDLTLQDSSGNILARVWEKAAEFDKLFQVNEVIKVEAQVETWQNQLQMHITKLRKAELEEFTWEDFIKKAAQDPQIMLSELKELADQVKDTFLKSLLIAFFSDPEFVSSFCSYPAGKSIHHVSLGGLLEHTLSLTKVCIWLANHYPELNKGLLISGAILHDIGKLAEMSSFPAVAYTDRGRLLGHIILGVEMIQEKIKNIKGFPESLQNSLLHLVVSHHGIREWGSPQVPQTLEAITLHLADRLDANLNTIREFMEQNLTEGSGWTPYHSFLERYFFRAEET